MKKEIGMPLIIGAGVVLLIAIAGYGWYMMNPPAQIRRQTGAPTQVNAGRGPGMTGTPKAGDFTR